MIMKQKKMMKTNNWKCELIITYVIMNICCISTSVQNVMKLFFKEMYDSNLRIQLFYSAMTVLLFVVVLVTTIRGRKNRIPESEYSKVEKITNIELYLVMTLSAIFLFKFQNMITGVILSAIFAILTIIYLIYTTRYIVDLLSKPKDH